MIYNIVILLVLTHCYIARRVSMHGMYFGKLLCGTETSDHTLYILYYQGGGEDLVFAPQPIFVPLYWIFSLRQILHPLEGIVIAFTVCLFSPSKSCPYMKTCFIFSRQIDLTWNLCSVSYFDLWPWNYNLHLKTLFVPFSCNYKW